MECELYLNKAFENKCWEKLRVEGIVEAQKENIQLMDQGPLGREKEWI